jgi:hypothetical protein
MKALILIALSIVDTIGSAIAPTETPQAAQFPSDGDSIAPMVLNGYSKFPRKIGTAPVYDLYGHRVGQIQKLDGDPTGKPTALEIWLPSGRTVTVEASDVSYDEQQNIVAAGLSNARLGILQPTPP